MAATRGRLNGEGSLLETYSAPWRQFPHRSTI